MLGDVEEPDHDDDHDDGHHDDDETSEAAWDFLPVVVGSDPHDPEKVENYC